jgi:hypothetical protein
MRGVFRAVIALTIIIGTAGPCAAQSLPAKGPQEAKNIALPKPGERVMLRVNPGDAPFRLSEAPRPAAQPERPAPTLQLDEEATAVPPPNNACSTATFISGIGDFAFDNSMATTDGLSHFACNFFGQPQIVNDVWFRWQAPVTARFIAETCSATSVDTKLAVYNTTTCTPGSTTVLGCNDDACSVQSRVAFNAIAGQQYLVRVGSFPGAPTGGPGVLRMAFDGGQTVCAFGTPNCQARDDSDAFDATGHLMYDDFTPTSSGSISGVCFWGAYYNGSTDCEATSFDQFYIKYYSYIAGEAPENGFVIAGFTPGQYTLTGPVPTGNTIDGIFPEYAYSIAHAGVPVQANTCFWISIENRLPPPPMGNCAWYWERGAPGNMIAYRDFIRIDEDMAYCISLQMDPATECALPSPPPNDACATATIMSSNNFLQFQDNLFATTSVNDPLYPCRFDGPEQGVGTMWYRFTASQTSARVSLCSSQGGDTLLALYGGTCGNLTQIACNEDFCGFKSQLCATGLTVGQTYYIQLASYNDASRGSYDIRITSPCPPAPANDNCSAAITLPIATFPLTAGDTTNATVDATAPVCGFSQINSPGLWYKVVGNGRTLTASLCHAQTVFDTKISVFCGDCSQLVCVADNDDDCGVVSEVSWCAEAGRTYYILVHGFNGQVGPFAINISTDATPCTTAEDCTTCDLVCPINAAVENEPCGGDDNGGCNSNPAEFQSIQCGQSICGTMFSFSNVRDTDWYQFTVTAPSVVTWTVQVEAPIEAMLLDTACPPTIFHQGTTDRCGSAVATALLAPGTYRAFVGGIGDGYPCGNSNDYIATLVCGAVGACCVNNDCTRIPESACITAGGIYAGDATVCPLSYETSTCANPFEDIAATGQQVLLGDNEGASVPIGFPFKFYGINYSTITISSNGYLTFDGSGGDPTNDPIPSTNLPNSLIAPLWDDLSPQQSSTIRYQALGGAPNRRLIAQWTNVPQFLANDSNTFQAVLYEGTNCLEFRYGNFTPENPPADYSVGVENQAGAAGTSIDPATLSPGACRRFCPVLSQGGCAAIQPCPGDANGDRVVSFADISSVLIFWGLSGAEGDANSDGVVNFADITKVLENWGLTCPVG